jgi:hypothetical protein
MGEKTQQLVKKFEQDYEVYVEAIDALTYGIIHARIPKSQEEGLHHLHLGKKYISGPNQDGNVLILPDPRISDAYQVESWGKMESFDDFIKKLSPVFLLTGMQRTKDMRKVAGPAAAESFPINRGGV